MRIILAVLLLSYPLFAGVPTYVGSSGSFTGSTTTCQPAWPASIQADDIALAVFESENEAITLSSANGFVEVTNSPQSAGTSATAGTRLAVYWKRLVGGDAAPIAADAGDHVTCMLHVFRGVKTSGNPWNITAGGNDGGVSDNSAVIPGATTTADNTLVVLLESTSNNATSGVNCSNWVNASLANLAERTDNSHTAGLGGGHCMGTGEKATAGAYSNTTLSLNSNSYKGAMSIALEGAADPLPTGRKGQVIVACAY